MTSLLRLRRRLTGVFAAAALACMLVFVLSLLAVSTSLDRSRHDTELAGAASRITALLFDDEEDGHTHVEGVVDDELAARGLRIVVFERTAVGDDTVLLALNGAVAADCLPLAHAALAQGSTADADRPVFALLPVDGTRQRAVGLPWWHDEGAPGGGAVVVVATSSVSIAGNRLLWPALLGGGAVVAVLSVITWVLAGRSIRPASAAIADRETFLSTAAHELRSPLARLRADAETARSLTLPGTAVAAALTRLMRDTDSAAHVVSNVLLNARTGHDTVRLSRVLLDLAGLAGELELTYPTVVVDIVEPVEVTGDRQLLRHALTNLVENALRHGMVGDRAPEVVVSVRRGAGVAVLTVADDGPGFPPGVDVLAHFVSGSASGTGLGLPLVAWIVRQHRGALSLVNGSPDPGGLVGAGANVVLTLPLA